MGSSLEISLDPDGKGGESAEARTISCPDPPSQDDAEPCALVRELTPEDLAPVPPDVACTEIFGGPDRLEVSGMLDGEPVDATLTRENGCEIERFDAWTPLLVELYPGYEPGRALRP